MAHRKFPPKKYMASLKQLKQAFHFQDSQERLFIKKSYSSNFPLAFCFTHNIIMSHYGLRVRSVHLLIVLHNPRVSGKETLTLVLLSPIAFRQPFFISADPPTVRLKGSICWKIFAFRICANKFFRIYYLKVFEMAASKYIIRHTCKHYTSHIHRCRCRWHKPRPLNERGCMLRFGSGKVRGNECSIGSIYQKAVKPIEVKKS